MRDIEARRGALTKLAVVDDARPPKSPLHKYFEWDDHEAAEQHRLEQAGKLIAAVREVIKTPRGDKRVRVFLSVQVNKESQYKSVDEIRSNPELSEQVLARAKMELDGWISRYELYQSIFAVTQTVKKASSLLAKHAPDDDKKPPTKGPRGKKK